MKLVVALVVSALLFQKDPTASDAWAEQGDRAVLVYATITNPTMYDVYIVSAKAELPASVELWQQDKQVTSLTVPAFGSLELKPGAARVRMFDFKSGANFKAGDKITLSLETDGGAAIAITAVVK